MVVFLIIALVIDVDDDIVIVVVVGKMENEVMALFSQTIQFTFVIDLFAIFVVTFAAVHSQFGGLTVVVVVVVVVAVDDDTFSMIIDTFFSANPPGRLNHFVQSKRGFLIPH